ncbi:MULTISPECIES: c-type cytochrome [Pasteurellaceae]|uniref:Cytochrome C n=1 Tax=Pasteurella bettyae CCUG 2042 TaxID=1095749 RepID=I3DIL5_9PAST|nr:MULTISPECIES: c-type cytochrome [Pasteurellaceae]EIJ71558.1 cytochrome C [Pasteurella bettyae CCUG 2042]SUB21747.1 tetratricopeptide-like helical family protein [Pasteurella bettyae]
MKNSTKIFLFSTALFTLAFNAYADIDKGKRLYKMNCATCHGSNAEKSAFDQSKVIKQLSAEEIIVALQDRKAGKIEGAGNNIKSRLNEAQMQDLAEFIQTLK